MHQTHLTTRGGNYKPGTNNSYNNIRRGGGDDSEGGDKKSEKENNNNNKSDRKSSRPFKDDTKVPAGSWVQHLHHKDGYMFW